MNSVDHVKVALIGNSSNLSKTIIKKLENHDVVTFGRDPMVSNVIFDAENIDTDYISMIFSESYDVYIFNIGYMQPKNIIDQTGVDIIKSITINAIFIVKACEYILMSNRKSRIFIIGSESGRKGSYDTSYFMGKSILRSYVRQRFLNYADQQLLLISPSTIEDSRMTQERKDMERVNYYRSSHPKNRFLMNEELSKYLVDIINNDSTYLCNTEIEINGGKFSRLNYGLKI
jgi:hypothetical protein